MCLLPLSRLQLKLRNPADRMDWLEKEGVDKARFERNVTERQRSKYLSRLIRSKVVHTQYKKLCFKAWMENKT